jgi:uncharacterized protein YbaP (TraB family)
MMKRRGAGYALLLLLAVCTTDLGAESACPPVATVPTSAQLQEAAMRARDRGVLWRFERDGRHGYLYGTLHVGKLEWAMPGRVVGQALRETEIIAMELDPTDPSVAKVMTAPQSAQDTPAVPPQLWRRLRALAANACVPWENLQALPAMMIGTTLEMLESRWAGLDLGYGNEVVLAGLAKVSGKEVAVLETVATQRAALLGGSPAEQIARLERSVLALENGKSRKSTTLIAEAWANGDLGRLERYREWCECDTPDERADLERLAFARNPGLAARIEDLHRTGRRVFAAIGILHMVGDKGVHRLLVARGFKVEQVAFDVP